MEAAVRRYLKQIAAKGGKAGTGKAKLRGGKAYYRRMALASAAAKRAKRAKQRRAAR